jgi:hypothetical protein
MPTPQHVPARLQPWLRLVIAPKIALTRMESLMWELHIPEQKERSEQTPVQAHSAQQRMSREGPRLGWGPSWLCSLCQAWFLLVSQQSEEL